MRSNTGYYVVQDLDHPALTCDFNADEFTHSVGARDEVVDLSLGEFAYG